MPQARKPFSRLVGAIEGIPYVESAKNTVVKTVAEMQAILGITSLDDYIRMGIYDYNDAATSTTPIVIPNTDTYVYITNDEQGAFTNKTYALSDVSDVWDATANEFDFAELALGDVLDIRLDLQVTTSSPNQNVDVVLEVASGTGGTYDIPFISNTYKNSGLQRLNRFNSIYMGDTNTRDNPAKFKIKSDGNATLVVNGWYCKVLKRT